MYAILLNIEFMGAHFCCSGNDIKSMYDEKMEIEPEFFIFQNYCMDKQGINCSFYGNINQVDGLNLKVIVFQSLRYIDSMVFNNYFQNNSKDNVNVK